MDFKFPDVGEGIVEGEIIEWLVKEGDIVKQDQAIARIETDKAVVDIPSPVEGKIKKINFKKGEIVTVGEVLVVIDDGNVERHKSVERKSVGVIGELEEADEEIAEKEEVLAMPGVRKTIANNMLRSSRETAPVSSFIEVDVTHLWYVRETEKTVAEKEGIKLTFLPFIIKAVVAGLKLYPFVNSSIENEEIVLKKYYNIGVAVDTKEGLLVPAVKRADVKDIKSIAKEIEELAKKANDRSIDIADLKGSTFTITNWGSVGGSYGTPIINYPECTILGVGRIEELPRVVNGKIVARKILPLSVTFDHRIVDGAEISRFLVEIKKRLEDPALLLI